MKTTVISLGGSIIVPDKVDTSFLKEFKKMVEKLPEENRLIIVCGGGKTCRNYNNALKQVVDAKDFDMDTLGIDITYVNARLLNIILKDKTYPKIIKDPTKLIDTKKRIIIAGGWKPGHSTDMAAIELAKTFGAKEVINMSNIDYVYDKDPNKHKDAEKKEKLTWKEFFEIVGHEWKPGMNAPFDPIASREAEENNINVKLIGKDVTNIKSCIEGNQFKGTLIK